MKFQSKKNASSPIVIVFILCKNFKQQIRQNLKQCVKFQTKNVRGNINHSICLLIGIISFLFISPIETQSQDNNRLDSNASYAEKIYLQLDGKVYSTENIIWFKCIVTNAATHVPSALSNILYVELIGEDETVFETKLIKLDNGIGQGYFYLNSQLPGGTYMVRAYTNWNKNFGNDFMYKEYIQVFTLKDGKENVRLIDNITLIKGMGEENHLRASLYPHLVDSMQKNKLLVIVNIDNKKDTLLINLSCYL